MLKVLVTGANGQLGKSIKAAECNYRDYKFYYSDIEELDITNYEETEKFILNIQPDIIINCASYNAVDKAEYDHQKAIEINSKAVQSLAGMAKKHQIGFVHISTDYIFDGQKGTAYTEMDDPNPQSKYAHSKYIGEQAVLTSKPNAAIIRTSWLYSEYAHNFVKTILKLAQTKDELRVVNDQIGTPTYAGDLAETILIMIPSINEFGGVKTYNYSNEGLTHWAEFAEAIIDFSGLDCMVIPVSTEEYGLTKAARPAYSLLDKSKIKNEFNILIPDWKESLKKCINNLEKEQDKHE